MGWVPRGARATVDLSGHLARQALAGYARGMVVGRFCDASIGLTILRVPLTPALAAVVFMGACIPVVGATSCSRWSWAGR